MQGGALAGRAPPSSTGTVDVTTAVTGNESCDATQTVHFERKSVFNVTHGGPDGGSVSSTGTVTAKSDHAPQAQAFTSTIVIDRNDELKDKTGTVVRSAHLTGTLTVDEDRSSGKPSRTTSGTLSAAKEDGRIDAIELGALVGPGEGCMFPSAGSIKRTAQDGAVTTLVFGATCGEATLDGAAVTLPKPPQMGPPR